MAFFYRKGKGAYTEESGLLPTHDFQKKRQGGIHKPRIDIQGGGGSKKVREKPRQLFENRL